MFVGMLGFISLGLGAAWWQYRQLRPQETPSHEFIELDGVEAEEEAEAESIGKPGYLPGHL